MMPRSPGVPCSMMNGSSQRGRAVVAQHAAVAAQPGETGELGLGVLRRHAVTSLTAETNASMSAWS